jgi:hypothetical protein
MNDISIQQTTNPLLTACIVYNWSTENSESMVEEILVEELRNEEEPGSKYSKYVGGWIDINSIEINDFTIAYHPLLPIYMIACSYNCNINSDLEGSIDYDEYVKYYNFLEKMTNVLLSEYLDNKNNINNIAKAYLIGLALRELLFTLNRDDDGIKTICNNVLSNVNIGEYQSFSLMNSMLSDYISGKIEETKEEKEFGEKLLQSSVFKKFINDDVKIKEIIINTPTNESIDSLKKKSLNLIIRIKDKIIADRKSDGNTRKSLTSTSSGTPTTILSGTSFGERENMSQPNSRKRSRDEITTSGGVKTHKNKNNKKKNKTKGKNKKKKGKKTIKKRKGKGNKKTRKH